jgi:hypothetical protein
MIATIALTFSLAATAGKEPEGWRSALQDGLRENCVSSETAGKNYSAEEISAVAHLCSCASAAYATSITYDELAAASKIKSWQDMPKLDNRLRVAADMKCSAEIKAVEAFDAKQ